MDPLKELEKKLKKAEEATAKAEAAANKIAEDAEVAMTEAAEKAEAIAKEVAERTEKSAQEATERAEALEDAVKDLEDKKVTEAQELLDSAELSVEVSEETAALGIKPSVVKMAGFKGKDDPLKVTKEEARHAVLIQKRVVNRIAKAKKLAGMKPIDKRKALIVSRFKAIRAKKRTYTYSNKVVEAWTEELDLINNNPKEWIRVTANGTKSFNPGNKRKVTAKEKLDGMNLDK